jgi:hypothetical protein
MDLKLISKNNVGTVGLLLLVIALSQARALNFLIDTALGRFFLIICIVGLSYSHKILGVVGVLFIIIMFNSNMYYEGFGNNSKSSSSSSTSSTDASSNSTDASSNSTTQIDTEQIKAMIKQQIADASNNNTSSDSSSKNSSKNSKGSEGFDVLGIENSIKRGKQSNSIPVNNFMRDSDSISPYEGSSILGNFSLF